MPDIDIPTTKVARGQFRMQTAIMKSSATTVEQYLASLPEDRRSAIAAVRDVILKNLDKDYEEGMQYGMIGYYVPHRIFPAGYHCNPKEPLTFAGLASQKNHMALYLMSLYGGCGPSNEASPDSHANWFQQAWRKTGKKLDMGKSCIRFKSLDDLPLQVIGEAIKRIPAKKWITIYSAALETNKAGAAVRKLARKAPVTRKSAKKGVK